MKLANKLFSIIEKFNGNSAVISTIGKLAFSDADIVYTINAVRGSATKALMLVKGDKARLFEIDMKMYITSSIGFGYLAVSGYTGHNIESDYFIKNVQSNWLDDIRLLYPNDSDRVSRIMKKTGTAKISGDTGWTTKDAVAKILIKAGIQPLQLTALPEFKTISFINQESKSIGDFSLIGFEDKHSSITETINKASKILKDNGFEKILYGNIFLVPKGRSKTVLADYQNASDDIRVFDVTSKNETLDSVRTMLHELGHRYYYKFISDESRRLINTDYLKALKETEKQAKESFAYKAGDVIKLNNHSPIKYMGYTTKSLNGRKYGHKFYILKADGSNSDQFYFFDSLAAASSYIERNLNNESQLTNKSGNEFLPSTYARTSSVEWFAEIFSFALINNSKNVIGYIKGLK